MSRRGSFAGYLRLVSTNRNFTFLWSGEIVSLLGDWFNLIASAALVAELTGTSGSAIGGLFVLRMMSPFVTSPLGGVLADRFDRRNLMIATDIARAIVVAGFLLVREPSQLWLLYVLTAMQLGLTGFFLPARNAILPELVERRHLGAANAMTSATWSVMLAFGAALGGLIAGRWGTDAAFAVDSVTFLVSAVILAQIRYQWPPQEQVPARPGRTSAIRGDPWRLGGLLWQGAQSAMREYVQGLGWLRRHRDIFAVALHKFFVSITISGAFQVLQVAMAEDVYEGAWGLSDAGVLGAFYAVVGVGTGVGPILARVFTGDRHRPLRWSIAGAYVVSAVGIAWVATLPSFESALVAMALRGFGGGLIWVFSTQLLLDLVPDRVRGRVFGTEFALWTLGNALGAAAAGWGLGRGVGLFAGTAVTAGLTIVPAVLWTAWMVAGEREATGAPGSIDPDAAVGLDGHNGQGGEPG